MRMAQLKLPVTDLQRSVDWYRRLLGLRLWAEFVEDGKLCGAGLIDPTGQFNIALRDRTVCAGRPSLPGFDVVAFLPDSRAELDELIAHCDRIGVAHHGIEDTPGGPRVDIPDPDGTILRFYLFTGPTDEFVGIETRNGEYTGTYDKPRLA